MSRKGERSLRHLLNFSGYEEEGGSGRAKGGAGGRARQGTAGGGGHGRRRSGRPQEASSLPFSREDYVKANFRFTLKAQTKATEERGRDNLEWADVESVVVKSEDIVSCPVCLDHVRAPRITACGHIFCCVCAYSLFAHAAEVWERCPLCFAFIRETDLRRVSSIAIHSKVVLKDRVRMVLLKRNRSGAVPVLANMPSSAGMGGLQHLPRVGSDRAQYARLSVDTRENVMLSCEREMEALRAQMLESQSFKDPLGMSLARRAYLEVEKLHQEWSVFLDPTLAATALGSASKKKGEKPGDTTEQGDVYFYQIQDGRYVFLDPFNVKVLAREFGTEKSLFPAVLESMRVLEVQNVVLTPEVVKRNSYLVHVPIHASVYFVEVDLGPLLSDETREAFKEEFAKRQKRREAKIRAEKRHERKVKERRKQQAAGQLGGLDYSNIDYRDYMERQKVLEREVERELAHAFQASLSGEILDPEMGNDSAGTPANQPGASSSTMQPIPAGQGGVWGAAAPSGVGSFAAVVNNNGHFPELSSSPPSSSVLSSSPSSIGSGSPPPFGSGSGWAVLTGSGQAKTPSACGVVAGGLLGAAAIGDSAGRGNGARGAKKSNKKKGKKGMLVTTSSQRKYR
ncbi:RING finger protein 10 [Durusdinium trenchii]|uniref:RING finger protein 10 n=1 Tax=Durusdinium trenchii TaxID=1381693 RepID=A0ABP0IUP8_9DINO